VSIGGLVSPVLGWLADTTGLRTTLAALIALPLLALPLTWLLHDPGEAHGSVPAAGKSEVAGV
jgi:FSR family fosmidomycin resistance protein-like MFS transporter